MARCQYPGLGYFCYTQYYRWLPLLSPFNLGELNPGPCPRQGKCSHLSYIPRLASPKCSVLPSAYRDWGCYKMQVGHKMVSTLHRIFFPLNFLQQAKACIITSATGKYYQSQLTGKRDTLTPSTRQRWCGPACPWNLGVKRRRHKDKEGAVGQDRRCAEMAGSLPVALPLGQTLDGVNTEGCAEVSSFSVCTHELYAHVQSRQDILLAASLDRHPIKWVASSACNGVNNNKTLKWCRCVKGTHKTLVELLSGTLDSENDRITETNS